MKRSIESSPNLGATLSSDLLCLCLDKRDNGCYLYSGGVDGRIHLWYGDEREPRISFAAHNGRVNSLVIINQLELLISSGHDGKVKCWDVSRNYDEECCNEQKEIMSIELLDQRILTMECMNNLNEDQAAKIILGTSSGELYTLAILQNINGTLSMILDETKILIKSEDICQSIHDLGIIPMSRKEEYAQRIVVAHADGLTMVNNS